MTKALDHNFLWKITRQARSSVAKSHHVLGHGFGWYYINIYWMHERVTWKMSPRENRLGRHWFSLDDNSPCYPLVQSKFIKCSSQGSDYQQLGFCRGICHQRRLNEEVLRTSETVWSEVPCHVRCGTIKIPPGPRIISTEQRPNRRQRWHHNMREKCLTNNK